MHHRSADTPETTGRVMHGARWYDLLNKLCTGGRLDVIRNTLVELAAPAARESVLDVGCGTGTLAIALRSKTADVHGIDASPEMIDVAKQKALKTGSDVDFRLGLIESIPFPDRTFDLVTSSLMLHHLPEDLKRKGLAEIRRVLKPGGRFVAMDLGAPGHSPVGHILSILGHGLGSKTVETLTPLLRAAGFDEVAPIPTRYKTFVFVRAR